MVAIVALLEKLSKKVDINRKTEFSSQNKNTDEESYARIVNW